MDHNPGKELLPSLRIAEFAGVADDAGLGVVQKAIRGNKQSERSEVEGFAQGDDCVIVIGRISIVGPALYRTMATMNASPNGAALVIEWRDVAIECRVALMLVAQPPSLLWKTQWPAVSTCLPPMKLPVQP